MLDLVLAAAVVVIVLLGVIVFAGRASNKRWTDEAYERERHSGTAAGSAFLTLQAVFDPGAQHALEQRMAEEAEDMESGGPADPDERRIS